MHFVIDEQIDQDFIKAIANRDEEYLTSIDEGALESSTRELENWIGGGRVSVWNQPERWSGGLCFLLPPTALFQRPKVGWSQRLLETIVNIGATDQPEVKRPPKRKHERHDQTRTHPCCANGPAAFCRWICGAELHRQTGVGGKLR